MYKKQIQWLNILSERLGAAIDVYGFEPNGFKLEYVRRYNWKSEVIYIFYKPHFPVNIIPQFMLITPPWPFEQQDQDEPYDFFERLSQMTVGYLDEKEAEIKVPTMPLFKERAINRVIKLIESHLDWFQQFETPNHCLEFLEKEYEERKFAPAYIQQKQYMEMLNSYESLDEFVLPKEVVNHDKYTKAYFGEENQ